MIKTPLVRNRSPDIKHSSSCQIKYKIDTLVHHKARGEPEMKLCGKATPEINIKNDFILA